MGQARLEWALLGVIALVCAGLSFLQYRWTGQLSRDELGRLRAGLIEQVDRLARAFDDEIRQSCAALLPYANELREPGREEAHRIRYQQWATSHDRGLFGRIGVVVPEQAALTLYRLDGDGRIAPMEWPSEWQNLRAQMAARIKGGGRPPSAPLDSDLIELPVLDASDDPHRPGPELEWMIFELSQDYLRSKALPNLVAEYLNSDDEAVYDASVSAAESGGPVIFSTRPDGASVARNADFTEGIFPYRFGGMSGRRHGRGGNQIAPARWVIAVRHRAGSLDAAVSSERARNLVTSLVLIGLLGGAAWALVRFTARSRRLSEMQFRFAAGVSHDLRTPLTAIRGAAFNIVDGVVTQPEGIRKYASLILRNAEELTAMIENVLAFSSSMRPTAEEPGQTFAVGDLLEHAAGLMAHEIEQTGCRLDVNVSPGLPPVAGDPAALELAFRNLIGNAIRHGAQGKWVGVSAAQWDGGVEIRVCDRGPGIPEREREKIFEPFYRGEQTRVRRIQGTGLGLSLVRKTVEKHHGTVTVDNSPAGGAQFTLRLPAASETV